MGHYDQDHRLSRVFDRVKSVKDKWSHRDIASELMRAVLAGEWEKVAADAFTDEYPAPMVANRIKVMSKDVAASLAPLPSVNCVAYNTASDDAKKFAEKRGRIARSYLDGSDLDAHMTDFATSYNTFGLGVFFVEPDFALKTPKIRVRDGSGVYCVWDAQGRTVWAFEEFCLPAYELAALFPAAEAVLEEYDKHDGTVRVIRYSDRERTVTYLPECGNEIVLEYAAPIPGECQYVCVALPGEGTTFSGVPRGAYDDLIWPQMADHEFRMLQLEAAHKAVNAPLAVTPDVVDVPYGPDALIRTQQPQNIRKVGIEIPNGAFAASELIREDLAVGGMSPESRTGNIQASVITGKGIEAASAGYSSQIANAQIMIAFALEQAIQKCFKMDEHLWGDTRKSIEGIEQGSPYTLEYTPRIAIKGKHTVDITYGFLSGMAPNNALVFVLQAQAAGLISRDFAARQLPVGMNVSEEFDKIDIETMRNSLMQGMSALAQSVPQMMQSGMDPTQIVFGLAQIIQLKQKGKAIEEAIAEVFAPKPPPPAPGSEEVAASDTAAGPAGSESGGGSPLAPDNLVPGAQALGPNDRPDLSMLFAGMSSAGNPVIQGGISRQNPVMGT
jgi:hypothetical protein